MSMRFAWYDSYDYLVGVYDSDDPDQLEQLAAIVARDCLYSRTTGTRRTLTTGPHGRQWTWTTHNAYDALARGEWPMHGVDADTLELVEHYRLRLAEIKDDIIQAIRWGEHERWGLYAEDDGEEV